MRAEVQELQARSAGLIVDDAQDCPQLVQLLAGVCSASDPKTPVHLVCLVRPSGRAAVTAALAAHFPVGTPMEIDLGRPNGKLVRELIDKLIPEVSPHHRDTIRRLVGESFFATVLLCTGVSQQKKLPQTLSPKQLRDYILHQPVTRAVGELCKPDKALRRTRCLRGVSPVRPGDSAIRESAASCQAYHSPMSRCWNSGLRWRVFSARTSAAGAADARPRRRSDSRGDLPG